MHSKMHMAKSEIILKWLKVRFICKHIFARRVSSYFKIIYSSPNEIIYAFYVLRIWIFLSEILTIFWTKCAKKSPKEAEILIGNIFFIFTRSQGILKCTWFPINCASLVNNFKENDNDPICIQKCTWQKVNFFLKR